MIEITARRMQGGTSHENVAAVRWRSVATGLTDQSTRSEMVRWLDRSDDNKAIVGSYPDDYVEVGTVHPANGFPHIRTHANGRWTDDLLALPQF